MAEARSPRARSLLSALTAVVSGMVTALAYPGLGWWPLVFVGTTALFVILTGRSFRAGFGLGLLAGFAFWGTHIFWLTVYLGPVPWLALAGLESIFLALGCGLIAMATRRAGLLPSVAGRPGGMASGVIRLGLVPVVVAGLWTLREAVSTTWPYGGFSWGRLSFSQSESPLAGLVGWVGVAGLSFLIAWVCALAAAAVIQFRGSDRAGLWSRLVVLAPVVALVLLLLVPSFAVTRSGSIRVAAVQGNSDAGLYAEYAPGEILQDHLAATEPLYGTDVDLVVWPENASDLDPLRSRASASVLDRVTREMGAPLIAGTITVAGQDIYNSLLLWQSDTGAIDQYDKIHPVPFAEYLPDRAFWTPFAPDLFALIPRDFSIGTRDNLFDIPGTDARAGVAICFDIVDDALVRQMVAGGANIIVAPTNNADFGPTDESVQQLAIARLRAIETGRSVVNTSTVGTTAIIAPDGATIDRLPTFTAGALVDEVPLSTTTTPATVFGEVIERGVAGVGIVGLLVLVLVSFRSKRRLRRSP